MEINKNVWNNPENERKISFDNKNRKLTKLGVCVSLFRQKATKYHMFLSTGIIKEIQTGPFTESTD